VCLGKGRGWERFQIGDSNTNLNEYNCCKRIFNCNVEVTVLLPQGRISMVITSKIIKLRYLQQSKHLI